MSKILETLEAIKVSTEFKIYVRFRFRGGNPLAETEIFILSRFSGQEYRLKTDL